jgi:hypothetical protein
MKYNFFFLSSFSFICFLEKQTQSQTTHKINHKPRKSSITISYLSLVREKDGIRTNEEKINPGVVKISPQPPFSHEDIIVAATAIAKEIERQQQVAYNMENTTPTSHNKSISWTN